MDQSLKILIPILLLNLHQVTANYTAPGKVVAVVFVLFVFVFVCLFVVVFSFFVRFLVLKSALYANAVCSFQNNTICHLMLSALNVENIAYVPFDIKTF